MKKSEKIRKNQKKSEKIGRNRKKKKSEIIRKLINNTCIHVYMTYWQYLIKVGRRKKKKKIERKKIEKYFKSSCLRELKRVRHFRAEILAIFSLLFWDKLIFHKDIIKLSDL